MKKNILSKGRGNYESPAIETVFAGCENGFCNSVEHESFTEERPDFEWE